MNDVSLTGLTSSTPLAGTVGALALLRTAQHCGDRALADTALQSGDPTLCCQRVLQVRTDQDPRLELDGSALPVRVSGSRPADGTGGPHGYRRRARLAHPPLSRPGRTLWRRRPVGDECHCRYFLRRSFRSRSVGSCVVGRATAGHSLSRAGALVAGLLAEAALG